MMHFQEFIDQNDLASKQFQVIGKGPSIAKWSGKIGDTIVISLNHVVRDYKVDIAHIIDFDVYEELAEIITKNAKFVLMPFYPHFESKAGSSSLNKLVKENSSLEALNAEGRLLWYNLGTKRFKNNPYPKYPAGFFSGDVVVGVLAKVGVKNVTLFGVDGGKAYSNKFSDLNDKTLFKNGQKSFDIQFSRIRSHIMENKIHVSHVNDQYPIKVYVATTDAQMLATKILEYSIRKHTEQPVDIIPMHLSGLTYSEPEKIENRQRTPFSFQRFLIPKLNGYSGKAIYMDSDMQVFTDVNKLWTLPMGESDLLTVKSAKGEGRKPHFSVMLIDCSKNNWEINKIIESLDCGSLNYSQLMDEMAVAKAISVDIPHTWNSLEYYRKGETNLIHYTDMKTQPWVSNKNPYESIWVEDLINAVDDKFIDLDYIKDHVEKGWVRPTLLDQVTLKIACSKDLPKDILKKDKGYEPPYEELICAASSVSSNMFKNMLVRVKKKVRFLVRGI